MTQKSSDQSKTNKMRPETKEIQSGNQQIGTFQSGGVLVISIAHFIHDIYTSFLAPLLPFIIEKLSLNLTQAGLLTTVMQIPALINPYIGKLADRISVRYFIILAPTVTAVPMSLLGIVPSYGVMLILLFVTGISVSLFHVPAPVMVYRLSGKHTGRGMSFFMTGGELARTLGPISIIAIVSLLGFEGYYPVMFVGMAVSAWMFIKFKDMPVTIEQKKKSSIRKPWSDLKHIFVPLTAILVTRGFMHAVASAFLPIYITQKTGNLWLAGISLSVLEGAGVAGIMTTGPLSDKFGRKNLLLFSLTCAPLGLFLFIYSAGWLRFAALIFTGFTLLSTTPVMLAMIQENARTGKSAANGLFMMISFLARSAVVVIVGFIADKIGLEKTYLISAGLGIIGIPFVFMLPSKIAESSED